MNKNIKFSIMNFISRDIEGHNFIKSRCEQCNYISTPSTIKQKEMESLDLEEIEKRLKTVCPNCRSGDGGSLWPGVSHLVLLDRLYFMKDNEVENEFAIIIFCSIFEGLLDIFLAEYLRSVEKVSDKISKLLFRKYQGVDQKTSEFYKHIIGKTFREHSKEMGFEDLYEVWIKLKEVRNNYIHLDWTLVNKDDVDDSFRFLPIMFDLFSQLHNKYFIKFQLSRNIAFPNKKRGITAGRNPLDSLSS